MSQATQLEGLGLDLDTSLWSKPVFSIRELQSCPGRCGEDVPTQGGERLASRGEERSVGPGHELMGAGWESEQGRKWSGWSHQGGLQEAVFLKNNSLR